MTLTDTGPLVALLDRDDSRHDDAVVAAQSLPAGPLMTTWPCFTEAMYLRGSVGGFRYQSELWKLHSAGLLTLVDLSAEDCRRAEELMQRHQNVPMDLADASLLVAAERLRTSVVFTFDGDFRIFRLASSQTLTVAP